MHEIRTYMSFTWPVDPAKIITLPDMDLSYALASTLVEWGPSKQLVSGLAESWRFVGNTLELTLQKDALWSDGKSLLSMEVKECFERGMKNHPEDWQSLVGMLDHISAPSDHVLKLHLKSHIALNEILRKLTEPNFGVTKIEDGKVNIKVTTGAFFASGASFDQLILTKNRNYVHFADGVADRIVIKKPPTDVRLENIMLDDKWPNLMQLSLTLPETTLKKYQASHFNFWSRPLDRLFFFQMGKRIYNEDGTSLFRFLNNHLSRTNLVEGLSGFSLTEQMFPTAYQLHDDNFNKKNIRGTDLPDVFKRRPIELMLSPERVSATLQKNIIEELTRITGHRPNVKMIRLDEQTPEYKKANYDFYAGTVGLADPDAEGLMSFYLENDYKIIPEINEKYLEKLNLARRQAKDESRIAGMRAILTDATYKGHIIPLFHLSTVGIATSDIDLSHVPPTDESVTLSKIRFKESSN